MGGSARGCFLVFLWLVWATELEKPVLKSCTSDNFSENESPIYERTCTPCTRFL